jgi:hypothetical protein
MSENRNPTLDEALASLDVLLRYLRTIPPADLQDFTMALECVNDDGMTDRDWSDARGVLARILDPNHPISGGRYA